LVFDPLTSIIPGLDPLLVRPSILWISASVSEEVLVKIEVIQCTQHNGPSGLFPFRKGACDTQSLAGAGKKEISVVHDGPWNLERRLTRSLPRHNLP
jgi:hypothetical protein